MTRVDTNRGRQRPANGNQPAEPQTTEEDEEAQQRPQRVVRMPYVAFLDPAKQKVKL
jgi:hypothetical protein